MSAACGGGTRRAACGGALRVLGRAGCACGGGVGCLAGGFGGDFAGGCPVGFTVGFTVGCAFDCPGRVGCALGRLVGLSLTGAPLLWGSGTTCRAVARTHSAGAASSDRWSTVLSSQGGRRGRLRGAGWGSPAWRFATAGVGWGSRRLAGTCAVCPTSWWVRKHAASSWSTAALVLHLDVKLAEGGAAF